MYELVILINHAVQCPPKRGKLACASPRSGGTQFHAARRKTNL